MKIIRFEAENIKRLRVVEITPSGNIVEITGANGAGKTSILDAIWYALGGGESIPSVPLRKGAKNGHVTLDLGEIIVTRKFSSSGSTLRVESQNGDSLKSPQSILDKLVGSLTFDPLAFSRMKASEQLHQLRGLVKLDVDIDELDRENQADYAKRTELNREAKSLAAQADGIGFPESTPDEEIDSSALVKALEDAGKANAAVQKAKADKQAMEYQASGVEMEARMLIESSRETLRKSKFNAEEKGKRALQVVTDAQEEADRLVRRALAEAAKLNLEAEQIIRDGEEDSEEQQRLASAKSVNAEEKRQRLLQFEIPEPVDTAALSQKIASATTTNRFVQRKKDKAALASKVAAVEKAAVELTRTIERREEKKREVIENARMPIDGLSFGDGQVLYKGIPFDQASSAEQLKVSTSIAIAMNPKLRVIRIQDGSLLDETNMAALAEMAEKHDQQVWIERLSGTGKSAIVIDAGEIVG